MYTSRNKLIEGIEAGAQSEGSKSGLHLRDNRLQSIAQTKQIDSSESTQTNKIPIQKKANSTGLPDNLKSGIENLSGYSMDDVKVHYNSSQPTQLNAHAYAQGTNIHIAPGQEKHLPHEAWHVVQQKQGRVKPTVQLKGKVNVNDEQVLEKEANVMGAKAVQLQSKTTGELTAQCFKNEQTVQRASFFVGAERYKTEELSYETLHGLLLKIKEEGDEDALRSLKDACERESKKLTKTSKITQEQFGGLLNIINGAAAVQSYDGAASSGARHVTQGEIDEDPYQPIAQKIGLLHNSNIQHWFKRKVPLPENLVLGIIAEALTADTLKEGLHDEPDSLVLTDLDIVKHSDNPEYQYTSVKQIDVLVVFNGPDGFIPIDLIETKAGLQGDRVAKTRSESASKVKALKEVPKKRCMVHQHGQDITARFDWPHIEAGHLSASTAGISEDHNIVLSDRIIKGLMGFLNLYHTYLNSQ